jgi:AcrR family transcriptional regulator
MGVATGRRRLSKDARRAELLRAGERVFSDRAFDDASIDDIAAEAGISKNLLYHYFAGKRELLLEVIRDSTERMLAATEPDLELEPIPRLRASLLAHLDYAEEHATGYIAVLRGSGADEEVLTIITAAQDHVVERTVATLPWPDGIVPPEVLLALRGWLGMIDALTLHWLEHKDLPKERVLDLLVDLFVAVLTTAGALAARAPGA